MADKYVVRPGKTLRTLGQANAGTGQKIRFTEGEEIELEPALAVPLLGSDEKHATIEPLAVKLARDNAEQEFEAAKKKADAEIATVRAKASATVADARRKASAGPAKSA